MPEQKPKKQNKKNPLPTLKQAREKILRCAIDFLEEAERGKEERESRNQENWRAYHGDMDWSHKRDGDSTIFLHKTSLAAEQITSLFKAAITNFDKFIKIERETDPNFTEAESDLFERLFTDRVASGILQFYSERAKIKVKLSDSFKMGLLESRATIKVLGRFKNQARFVNPNSHRIAVVENKLWELDLDVLPFEDLYLDPHGDDLYKIHGITDDKSTIQDMVRDDQNKAGLYLQEEVDKLTPGEDELDVEQDKDKHQEGETTFFGRTKRRFPVRRYEMYARKLLDDDGSVMKIRDKGSDKPIKLENVMLTFTKSKCLLQPPEAYPSWHGKPPLITTQILRVPLSVWGKAVMDAAVDLNMTLSELFSLMLDGALNSAHNVKTIRPDLLEDPRQVDEGVRAGDTLKLSVTAPQNAKVMDTIKIGEVPPETLAFYNIVDGLFAENAMTNQVKLGGLPSKQVRATEIVAANQAISGIFDGISQDFEETFIEPLAEMMWMDILQNIDEFPVDDLVRLIGNDTGKTDEEGIAITNQDLLEELNSLTRQERFRLAAKGFKWRGVGLKTMSERLKDFQRISQYLAVVGQNELMLQTFQQEFSMTKLHGKILRSLGVNEEELRKSAAEIEQERKLALIRQQALSLQEVGAEGATEGRGPNPDEGPPPEQPGAEADQG